MAHDVRNVPPHGARLTKTTYASDVKDATIRLSASFRERSGLKDLCSQESTGALHLQLADGVGAVGERSGNPISDPPPASSVLPGAMIAAPRELSSELVINHELLSVDSERVQLLDHARIADGKTFTPPVVSPFRRVISSA